MTSRDESKSQIRSLAKGFKVLEAFSPYEPNLTLTEICAKTGLDTGTVHRIINTLLSLGYLDRVPGTRKYRLSLKVLDIGFTAIGHMDLRALTRPILRSLVGQVNEAASLGTLDGGDIVYVERVHAGLVRLGVDVRIGARLPAYHSTLGHSILAYLPEDEKMRVLEARERIKISPKTPTTLEEIEERLERVRRNGYALGDQEIVQGLRVLAVPVFDVDGHVFASASVAAPAVNMSIEEFMALALAPLQKVAADIGKAMQVSGITSVGSAFSE